MSKIQKKGKLIVIDGGDGSGKTTQATLLVNHLKKKKIAAKYIHFPRYHTFYGEMVARFLRGEFGSLHQISPYLSSLIYALDRASAKEEMEKSLQKGGIIITDRYATANMAHQGANFKNIEERSAFLKWLYELEYQVNQIPKENLVVYLYVPWKIGLFLTKKKEKRKYLKGEEIDILESDLNHRQETEKMYLQLAKENEFWVKIDCVKNGKMLSKEVIHQKIISLLQARFGFAI